MDHANDIFAFDVEYNSKCQVIYKFPEISGAHLHGHPAHASLGGVSEQSRMWILRVSSALFYALASFMIMVINKRILTVYKFPSFQVST